MVRASLSTISCAWSSREICTGTSSRPLGGRGNQRRLGDVGGHREAHAAEQLDPLGDLVDQLALLLEVLVEQQVQLVEGRARHLPVVLLVEVAQRHGVGEQLVEVVDAFPAASPRPGRSACGPLTERLDLVGVLPGQRRGVRGGASDLVEFFMEHSFCTLAKRARLSWGPNSTSLGVREAEVQEPCRPVGMERMRAELRNRVCKTVA